MKTMICLAVFAVTMSVAYAAIGKFCSTDADCGAAANWQCMIKTDCANGTCGCKTEKAGAACDKLVDGQDCTVANDPTQCHAPSICVALVENGAEGKCTPVCEAGKEYNWDTLACYTTDATYAKAGEDCATDLECLGGRVANDMYPTCDIDGTDKCACAENYVASSDNINCVKLDYGATCSAPAECQSGVCTDEKCKCTADQERYEDMCLSTGGTRDIAEGAECEADFSKTCASDLACCPIEGEADSTDLTYKCMDEEEGGSGDTSGASAVSAVLFTIASAIMAMLF